MVKPKYGIINVHGALLPDYRGFDIWQFSESIRINGMGYDNLGFVNDGNGHAVLGR